MGDNNLLDNQKIEDITGEDALKLLVGEEAKYKSVEDLAKAALHGQKHITTIEEENQQLRDQVAKSKTIDELLEKIRGGNGESEHTQVPQEDNDPPSSRDTPSPQDIEQLLEAKLADREKSLVAQQNKDKVIKSLLEEYGNSADSIYRSVGKSLNVDLDALSETSPQAVLNLVRASQTKSQPTSGLSGGFHRDQGKHPARHAMSKKAIQAKYDAGEINITEKHRMEYEGVRLLGNAFWDD